MSFLFYAIPWLDTTVTTWVNTPPSPMSMQFWLFPMFFIMMPAGIFIGVGSLVRLDVDALIFLFLLGANLGAILGLFANIVPLGLNVLLLTIFIVYIWRGSGNQ